MLNTIAWISLGIASSCFITIAVDEIRHPQKMWIMNIVWPITSLYFSVFCLWAYFSAGRRMSKSPTHAMSKEEMKQRQEKQKDRRAGRRHGNKLLLQIVTAERAAPWPTS